MRLRRRSLAGLAVVAGIAAPIVGRAQAPGAGRMRRIAALLPARQDDAEYSQLIAAFTASLRQAGWREGTDIALDIRWSGTAPADLQRDAEALAALNPDAILASGSAAAGPLLRVTRAVPVVFVIVPDPVGAGFVESLARPGGNATGFTSFDYAMGAKWLELLREFAPDLRRVGVVRDPAVAAGPGQWEAIRAAAPQFGVEAVPLDLAQATGPEAMIQGFAAGGRAGLLLTSSGLAVRYRDALAQAALANGLPSVAYASVFVARGALASYGADRVEQFQRAAGYVDRVLRGERPAALPVQAPTRLELAVNLKTARALGLAVPPAVLARADEVIE